MKHTQGKWEVDKQGGGVSYIRCNKDYLATMEIPYDGKNNAQKEIEAKANANLIASAPELLQEYKNVIGRVRRMAIAMRRHELGDWVNDWLNDDILDGKAIAKAEGGVK